MKQGFQYTESDLLAVDDSEYADKNLRRMNRWLKPWQGEEIYLRVPQEPIKTIPDIGQLTKDL